MPMTKRLEEDGFTLFEEITAIDEDAIAEARAQFAEYKKKGIIIEGEYDASAWRVTNEVTKSVLIDFSVNELEYRRLSEKKLGCSYSSYQAAIRVYAICRLRFALVTVVRDIRTICCFAKELELPSRNETWFVIRDFLDLLPGWTDYRDKIIDATYNILPSDARQSHPRILQSYRSYFRFDHYLSKFWREATPEEKTLYFPLWLWWHVTMVIPLRVTEFVLTPRDCISEVQGKYYIELRRTRLKSQNGAATHTIEGDYELCRYEITETIYNEIFLYQVATNDAYDSDIDTLFCKTSQFTISRIRLKSDRHYTYTNLFQLLSQFYDRILAKKYGLNIVQNVDDEILPDNAISNITLGDTRHIANVNLMVSGHSAVLCKELSRHKDVQTSSEYYGSVKSFLDALSFEFIPTAVDNSGTALCPASLSDNSILDSSKFIQVTGGYCASAQLASGDYSPCLDAIGASGEIGCCDCCPYFCPNGLIRDNQELSSERLKESCDLFVASLDAIRSQSNQVPMESVLAQLQSSAAQYLSATAVERRYKEMFASDK